MPWAMHEHQEGSTTSRAISGSLPASSAVWLSISKHALDVRLEAEVGGRARGGLLLDVVAVQVDVVGGLVGAHLQAHLVALRDHDPLDAALRHAVAQGDLLWRRRRGLRRRGRRLAPSLGLGGRGVGGLAGRVVGLVAAVGGPQRDERDGHDGHREHDQARSSSIGHVCLLVRTRAARIGQAASGGARPARFRASGEKEVERGGGGQATAADAAGAPRRARARRAAARTAARAPVRASASTAASASASGSGHPAAAGQRRQRSGQRGAQQQRLDRLLGPEQRRGRRRRPCPRRAGSRARRGRGGRCGGRARARAASWPAASGERDDGERCRAAAGTRARPRRRERSGSAAGARPARR